MDKVTIKIPRSLYEKLKVITNGSGYSSVTEFIVHVLRDLVSGESISSQAQEATTIDNLTQEEIAVIRKRLQNLGYLD